MILQKLTRLFKFSWIWYCAFLMITHWNETKWNKCISIIMSIAYCFCHFESLNVHLVFYISGRVPCSEYFTFGHCLSRLFVGFNLDSYCLDGLPQTTLRNRFSIKSYFIYMFISFGCGKIVLKSILINVVHCYMNIEVDKVKK